MDKEAINMKISYYLSKILKKMHIAAIKNSDIEHSSKVGPYSNLINVCMKKYSYIGANCTIVETEIGAFCSIADNVIIGGASHPINWISTSPVFYKGKNFINKNFSNNEFIEYKNSIIKNDVWIGNNSLIKAGLTIENGAVIGMGSIVTKDVGPYEIWAGNPAKLIRKRFSNEDIEVLINSNWWDWSEEKLSKYADGMSSKDEFIKFLKQEEKRKSQI